MILRIVKGDNPDQNITVDGNVFAIGREKDNDFVINDPGISRHHCVFRHEDGQWWVEDLQSVNGVAVNAVKISEKTRLRPGDEITVFSHIFVFEPLAEVPAAVQGLKVRKLDPLPGDTSTVAPPAPSAPASDSWSAKPETDRSGIPIMLIVKIAMLLIILALAGYMTMLLFSSGPKESAAPLELAAAGDSTAVPTDIAPATTPGSEQTTTLLDPAALAQLAAPVDEAPMFAPLTDTAAPAETTRLQPLPQAKAPAVDDEEDEDAGEQPTPLAAGAASELVLVTSEPSDAEVYLDDQPVGKTPLLLRETTPGRHLLRLRKDGYEDLTRQIQVPDRLPSRPYQLRLKAGTLLITSEPSGAWVMQGRRFLGLTPLLLSELPAGEHEFVLRGPGCEPQKVAASVNPAAGETVRAELNSLLGNIELNSRPPGCRVYLDGVLMGETAEMEGNPMRAAPFVLKSLASGPALLKVEHPSGINVTGKVNIPKGGTLQQAASLWVPTHRLTMIDGTVKIGLLLEENELGDVALEEVGRRNAARYLKPQIAELHRLSNDEIADFIAQSKKGSQDATGAEAMGLARKDDLVMSVADMLQDQRRLTINDFNATYRDKQIRISGNSSTRYKDTAGTIVVEFGTPRAIRCTFEKNTPNEDWEIISQAAKSKTPISLRGFCVGLVNDTIIMNNCSLVVGLQ